MHKNGGQKLATRLQVLPECIRAVFPNGCTSNTLTERRAADSPYEYAILSSLFGSQGMRIAELTRKCNGAAPWIETFLITWRFLQAESSRRILLQIRRLCQAAVFPWMPPTHRVGWGLGGYRWHRRSISPCEAGKLTRESRCLPQLRSKRWLMCQTAQLGGGYENLREREPFSHLALPSLSH